MAGSPLHIHTPLIESYPLGKLMGCRVWLKLDNLQPSDSFKLRGIGHHIQNEFTRGKKRVVTSSGGNAGLAAAYAGRKLGMPVKVIVPGSTSQYMRDRIAGEGAEVIVHGQVWNHANERAIQEAEDPEVALIHPFDHPDVWEGHESLIHEVQADLSPMKPDLVVTVVGGGGLLIGIRQGLDKVGWQDVPVLAMETEGANCFRAAIEAGEPVTIPDITSIATTLGALRVADRAFALYQKGNILSGVISDKQCIEACAKFADDHRMLVEPSCGAGLAAIYHGVIKQMQQEGHLPAELNDILMVVCGGHSVTMDMLEAWKKQFGVL